MQRSRFFILTSTNMYLWKSLWLLLISSGSGICLFATTVVICYINNIYCCEYVVLVIICANVIQIKCCTPPQHAWCSWGRGGGGGGGGGGRYSKDFCMGRIRPGLSTPYPLKYHPGGKIGTLLYTSSTNATLFCIFDRLSFISFVGNVIVLLSPFC